MRRLGELVFVAALLAVAVVLIICWVFTPGRSTDRPRSKR